MKRIITAMILAVGMALLFPSCSLFKKVQKTTQPAAQNMSPVPEKKPEPLPAKATKAPYQVPAFAKKVYKPVFRVALFTPLYLDQITSDTGFAVNNRNPLPANAIGGLEFYEGALLALDSLEQQGIRVHLEVYDTKSTSKPLDRLLRSGQLDSVNLMIGAVSGSELQEIGRFAKKSEINFISATYPNDAGITDNPFLTILNSTIRMHCNAIQHFAQQKFSNKNILVIYQNTSQEKQNLDYLEDSYKQMKDPRKSPLQPVSWNNNTTTNILLPKLSQDKNNIIILTALYPQVAESIIGQLIPLTKDYTINVVGMPTLDGDATLRASEYAGINIYYSTPYPYSNAAQNPAINSMIWNFFRKYRSRPSDMALKGFESLFYFGTLLHRDGQYFNSDMNDPAGRLLTRFNIQPVYRNHTGTATGDTPPDYFENIHLYFMQIRDGKVMSAN